VERRSGPAAGLGRARPGSAGSGADACPGPAGTSPTDRAWSTDSASRSNQVAGQGHASVSRGRAAAFASSALVPLVGHPFAFPRAGDLLDVLGPRG